MKLPSYICYSLLTPSLVLTTKRSSCNYSDPPSASPLTSQTSPTSSLTTRPTYDSPSIAQHHSLTMHFVTLVRSEVTVRRANKGEKLSLDNSRWLWANEEENTSSRALTIKPPSKSRAKSNIEVWRCCWTTHLLFRNTNSRIYFWLKINTILTADQYPHKHSCL